MNLISCDSEENKVCLPDLIICENYTEINDYIEKLYHIFRRDFIDSFTRFNDKNVHIRKEPLDNNKESAFIHLTHEDYYHNSANPNDRVPDFRRSERLPWIKAIIENYKCSLDKHCGRILYWEEIFRGYTRINLLYKDEKYLVVLEKRDFGYLLITGFYLDTDWALEKRIKKYNQYIKQKTPLT